MDRLWPGNLHYSPLCSSQTNFRTPASLLQVFERNVLSPDRMPSQNSLQNETTVCQFYSTTDSQITKLSNRSPLEMPALKRNNETSPIPFSCFNNITRCYSPGTYLYAIHFYDVDPSGPRYSCGEYCTVCCRPFSTHAANTAWLMALECGNRILLRLL